MGTRSVKRCHEDSDTETPAALALTDAKRWAYQNLGQDLLASPPVAAHELDPCDLGDPPPVEPDFDAIPLSLYEATIVIQHNRVGQALDTEVLDPKVDCTKKPLLSITNDADSTTEGLFLAKRKCHMVKVGTLYCLHSTPLVTDRTVPVDQDMLALVPSVPFISGKKLNALVELFWLLVPLTNVYGCYPPPHGSR